MLDAEGGGDVLVFLPGFREIRQARDELVRMRPHLGPDIAILHGRLPPEEQRGLLAAPPGPSHRIILATNVAETSLTIPGVRAVVDSGLERRVRFHPRTGMDHWETVEISAASAVQRQGRAGRLGPGICLRWYRSAGSAEKLFTPGNHGGRPGAARSGDGTLGCGLAFGSHVDHAASLRSAETGCGAP